MAGIQAEWGGRDSQHPNCMDGTQQELAIIAALAPLQWWYAEELEGNAHPALWQAPRPC